MSTNYGADEFFGSCWGGRLSLPGLIASLSPSFRTKRVYFQRNNRGYQIARLYCEVKEFELAKRYIAGFLSVKESFAPAHKLLGEILEGLNLTDKAITAYKRSLELDDKQKGVLLKICELYLQSDIDPERAKYWVERAEKVWPRHDTVFKLREKIYTERDGDANTEDLEHLLTEELVKRPGDPQLRAKLLRLFIDTGRTNEAYDHAVEAENKAPYVNSVEWYQCLQDVFQVYQEESGDKVNGAFHQNLLLTQCQLTTLLLEQRSVANAADSLHKFDQTVQKSTEVTGGEEWQVIFREMQAQLYYLAGTLLLKRAQKDHLGWLEATEMASACFTASYASEPPHTKAPWFAKASDVDKRIFQRLVQRANMRASQTGHMMRAMCKGDSQKWVSSIKEAHFGEKGPSRLYDTLFTLRHMKSSKPSSHIFQGSAVGSLLCVYPTDAQLREYDRTCHLLHEDNLHYLTWIALQYYSVRDKSQPNYDFAVFEDLQYSTGNLELTSPESLSRLDIMVFLYATVRTTALQREEQERSVPPVAEKPAVLPALISEQLCTTEQQQWWNTAYSLFKNKAKENLGKMRLVLQRGIETVRLRRNHGMDVLLLVHIARTFEERVDELKSKGLRENELTEEAGHLQNRAVQFWKEATDVLERNKRNQCFTSPKQRLFVAYEAPLSDEQIDDLLEEGKYFLAYDAMVVGEDEFAVQQFEKLNLPEASYYQSQILRKLADEVGRNTSRWREDEAEQQEEALLTRARDALYLTMDRTRDNKHHKLAPFLGPELDEIETRLNRLGSNRTSNESARSEGKSGALVPEERDAASAKAFAAPSAHSTPQQKFRPKLDISLGNSPQKSFHAQPSPERLDAQIRSLSFSQDTLVKQLMERNEELVKQNAAILAELSASRKLIEKLLTTRQEAQAAPATYPVVMPAAAASPLHHPVLAPPHPNVTQSPLGPHATSTPPRPVQPVPPGAVSPFYGSPYRPHPEYDYAAAYSPHAAGYPLYPQGAPPMPHHYSGFPAVSDQEQAVPPQHTVGGAASHPVPVTALAGAVGKEPSAAGPVKATGTPLEEDDEYFYLDEDDEGEDEDEGEDGELFQAQDPQLVHDWPYGNAVTVSGKSTINYSPQRGQQHVPVPPPAYFGQGPATTGLPMPGPGFFSSPERPAGAYNAGRFVAPASGALNGVSPQLYPPRPGFIPTIGSPASATQTAPSAAVANPTVGITSGRAPAAANTSAEAALTGDSLIKMAQQSKAPTATKFAIPLSSDLFSGAAAAAKPHDSAIPVVSGMGAVNKDVQPKSPGLDDEDDDEGAADESYQGPEFDPIIPLPDEVEVKTGEEEEEILFETRCKLYRYTENQWKERGSGNIKILWNKQTDQARVVMRREQVMKVCTNHYITPDMKIAQKSAKETKILTWIGLDFSETSAGVMESFSARFSSEDIALNFKAKFEEGKALVEKAQKEGKQKPTAKKSEEGADLFAKFKPKVGSWDCEMCLVNNTAEATACASCGTPKPGTDPKAAQPTSLFGAAASSGASAFTFGNTSPAKTTGFVFGQTAAKQDDKANSSATSQTFTFGTPASETGGFKFSSSTASGFTFGTVTTTTATATNPTAVAISPPKFTFTKAAVTPGVTPASDALKFMASKAESSISGDKPTLGGFTFSTKPVIVDKKEEQKSKEPEKAKVDDPAKEATKQNPFASFTFGATKSISPKGQKGGTFVFGDSPTSGKGTDSDKKTDAQRADTSVEGGKNEAADESGHADDFEPDVHFTPVIPLPDLVDVTTGEEEEEILFSHRAKLYRHDNESKQWKERGVGDIKILKHMKTGRCRVLMRREQIFKLCANHRITKEMSLQPLKTSRNAWCWFANDFSEDEAKYEQLATKFKETDTAQRFKDIFEECQKNIGTSAEADVHEEKESFPANTEAKPSLGEMFRPKAGQWSCEACYVQNEGSTAICVACGTTRPGHETEAAKQKAAEPKKDAAAGAFKFGTGDSSTPSSGQLFTFGTPSDKKSGTAPTTGFLFGMPASSPKSSLFSFTSTTNASSSPSAFSTSPGGDRGVGGFKFGAAPEAPKTPPKDSGKTTTFGMSSSGFTFTPTSASGKQDPKSPQSPEGDFYVNTEGEDSHIFFEPIVQLPEKVDLVTGEENEEPLYCHRAKLFRFDDNQWKERGVGDVKILRNKDTGNCRLLMRREQILKICLNHGIDHSLDLQPMQGTQGKAWVWVARDYAEGEYNDEKLAIKFKTAEIADEFKKAFDEAKDGKGKALDLPPTPVRVRERTDSSSRDSTRERKDSARERKDSAKERERRQSSGRSDTPDKLKPSSSLESFAFKPQVSAPTTASSASKVSFAIGSSDSKVTSVFGGGAGASSTPGKFSFGSTASVSTGFNFTSSKTTADPSAAGDQSSKSSTSSSSLLAQMLMSDEPVRVPDVEVVYEKKPSQKQVAKAEEFKLPPSFYNYEDSPPCPGCRGCETDDTYHKDVVFVKEELPSPEKVALAEKYMLPKSFFMYENKPSCPGCLGCKDDIEGKTVQAQVVTPPVDAPPPVDNKDAKQQGDSAVSAAAGGGPLFGANTSSDFSFAAIAAKSNTSPGFGKGTSSTAPFSFAGSGKPLFSNIQTGGDDDDGNEDVVVQSDDIVFEPVVQLEEVEVKTGEEDETCIYSQRSKLFKHTDNQWKERGIGEMKILQHNQTGKFRLLMRREQIHKICCNHSITPELNLLPMKTSEVAWCWVAVDFSEGHHQEEQFALKFKNQELAKQFKEKFEECQKILMQQVSNTDAAAAGAAESIETLKATSSEASGSDHAYTQQAVTAPEASGSGAGAPVGAEGAEEEDDDDEQYETDEEAQPLFSKRGTLFYEDSDQSWKQIGMGDLQVLYEDDVSGNRIRMTKDNGALICNHIICREYYLQSNEKKKFVEWTANDFSTDEPVKRTFRVQFSSKNAVSEFRTLFAQSVDLAKHNDIRESNEFVPTPIFSEN